jgi:acyl-CoA synthetase (AMP-forming)/AMP-acid ligase II
LGQVPGWQARKRGDDVALIYGQQSLTWSELDVGSHRVAQALAGSGVLPGRRVAFLGKDSCEAYEFVFGSAKAGTVLMGVNWRLAVPEVRFILEDGEAELLVVGAEFVETLSAAWTDNKRLTTVLVVDGEADGLQTYSAWRDAATADEPEWTADTEDVVVQMYTSGTTGHPKGVQLAHRSFFAVVANMTAVGDEWIGWSADDVSLFTLPAFHIGGIWWAMTSFVAGARSVVPPTFVAWEALELIERHKVSQVCLVPAMIGVMLEEPSCAATDVSSLKTIVYGGSPIPEPTLVKALDVFGCHFGQIYGLTETGNTAVFLRHADHVDPSGARLKAAGCPYPGVSIKIIDEQGAELGVDEVGEVCIHSPANMVGYWKRPEATAATLVDGWIHTGDAGSVDAGGCVFICDRLKDLIISAGENIYPAEVESALCGHPGVAEAAVIGVPDDRWGELIKAFVVLREGSSPELRDIIEHCRSQLADFKVPHSIDKLESLPRTPSGKIKKALLRRPFWEGRERQVN